MGEPSPSMHSSRPANQPAEPGCPYPPWDTYTHQRLSLTSPSPLLPAVVHSRRADTWPRCRTPRAIRGSQSGQGLAPKSAESITAGRLLPRACPLPPGPSSGGEL